MTDSLPIIDELRAAPGFLAMAEWLARCPIAIFASHGVEIVDVVSRRGGAAFGDYARGYIAAASAVRAGKFGNDFDETGNESRRLMDRARMLDSRARDFVGLELGWWRGGEKSSGVDLSSRPSGLRPGLQTGRETVRDGRSPLRPAAEREPSLSGAGSIGGPAGKSVLDAFRDTADLRKELETAAGARVTARPSSCEAPSGGQREARPAVKTEEPL